MRMPDGRRYLAPLESGRASPAPVEGPVLSMPKDGRRPDEEFLLSSFCVSMKP